ncbi:MAG TPA: cation:dicarboxylase symporter family transporter [Xanthomonadaceae bacterium]|nr:cation:dicarboxylase symporter family transporter [Xanthomonadaceae bacterium]
MGPTNRILLALAGGALLGLLLAWFDPVLSERVADAVQPIGRLWLNALQMTVVPLVLALVVVGVNTASDAAASGRIARRAVLVFLAILSGASLYAMLAAPALLSLFTPAPELTRALGELAPGAVATVAPGGWSESLVAIIPSNAIAAAAAAAMLPLVVFALFLGFALTRIDPDRRALALGFFQAIADAMIVIVHWVLWAAPLGVFALILAVCARAGLSVLSALGLYIGLLCVLYLVATAAMVLSARLWGGEPIRRFAAAIAPAQAVAGSTQSSLGTLPAMLESANERLGYPTRVTALVLPMAVTLMRITSPIQYLAVAAFVAWAYGIDPTATQWLAGAALAVVISLGSVGLPGQVSFMATNLPVAASMGLPVAPLGLLLAVDTLPDVFATVGNVTADLTATSVVVRQSREDR